MSNRNFLVIVDGSDEMEVALLFACTRAKKTNGHVILTSIISKNLLNILIFFFNIFIFLFVI